MSKCLVIGYGSIGRRHCRVLEEAGHSVAIHSRRELGQRNSFLNLKAALDTHTPEYVVVSTETSTHRSVLQSLAKNGFNGKVLVEKPLFEAAFDIPQNNFASIYCGYQLRFHPLLIKLKSLLKDERIFTFSTYVGQYLPNWRPGIDYRDSYSAKTELGGGVLLDLSHEIDFTLWMLEGWGAVTARGGKESNLDISSDDSYSILLETPRCRVVSIHLNYLDRAPRRQITVNTTRSTIHVDLISGEISENGSTISEKVERDAPYAAMHNALLSDEMNGARNKSICTVEQARDVLELISAAKHSSLSYQWSIK